jgi:CRISPR-associated protein Csd1
MILNRLYELAVREKLLAEPAFEEQPVPYVIVLDEKGQWIPPLMEHRGEIVSVKQTKKGEAIKRIPDKGIMRSIPRPHGNTANQGFARYFVDTLPRVLPVEVEEKDRTKVERSRATFWQQIDYAAEATNDPALRAAQVFGKQLVADEALQEQIRKAVSACKPGSGDRVTFAYHPDGGKTILERSAIRQWYANYFRQFTETKQQSGPIGFCTITGTVGPLPTSHPIKLNGVPGGLPTGVSIVSFDKAAFQHYGLDGAANAAIGFEAADGYARGFQWLRGRKDNRFVVGGTLFLFWTREPADTEFVMTINEPEAEQVKALLENVTKGRTGDVIDNANDFYLLAVSGNSARAIIRDYLELPVGQVRTAVRQWFHDLRIADPSKEYRGQPNAAFSLWMLANATAAEADRVSPDTHARLIHAALTVGPLPDSILAACLSRLKVPERDAKRSPFSPARMGLIKLCLNRTHFHGDDAMTETLNPDETHPAYLYGRLLRVFEEIQYAALGDVNSSVVDKFYGTFSAAPALIFARLYSNAQNHMRKVRAENEVAYFALDKRLAEVTNLLPASPPKSTQSLADQGRFALGFYHQKAKTFAEIAERKRQKTENK